MAYLMLMLVTGCLIAMQSPINAVLARKIGSLEAGLVSFLTGSVVLAIVVIICGKGQWSKLLTVPAWQWTGGVLGAIMVCSAIVSVPRIGVLATVLAMILGNIGMAVVIDNYGWFGAPVHPVNLRRIFGLALTLCGLWFVFKN